MTERRRTTKEVQLQRPPHPLGGLESGPEGKGKGHKAEGGEAFTSSQILLIKDTFNPRFPIEVQGGVLLLNSRDMVAAVLPPDARRGARELLELKTNDLQKVYMIDKELPDLILQNVNSGLEAEVFGFDPETGDIKRMMNPGDPFANALKAHNEHAKAVDGQVIPYTVEMTNNCVELTFPHGDGNDPLSIHEQYLGILKGLITVSEDPNVNVIIAPMANIPHTRITPQDITHDPYTYDMTFKKQGWGAAQHFDIASIQPHVEIINHEAARNTINYLQHVMPVLFAPTLSGPFMDGQITPDLEERYKKAPTADTDPLKQETIEAMEKGEHHSYRPFGRFFGSPSGGILQSPIPVDESQYIEKISTLLEDGTVNSVGRVGGHHTDRYRVDIPEHGTIELCALDPAGGRIERVIAMREFTRALAWKMQIHYINGDFEKKTEEYKALFGQFPSGESFQTDHFNMMKVAKNGPDAVIRGMDGEDHSVREMWRQLRQFVQEPFIDKEKGINYKGLPQGIVDEITRSFMDPTEMFGIYRDENGITSSQGFLETGIGTSSQWRLQGAKDRIAQGATELDAIKADTIDVGKTYHEHVKATTADDLRRMFSPGFKIGPVPQRVADHIWNYQLDRNLIATKQGEQLQAGHTVELTPQFAAELTAGAKATHDIIVQGILDADGVTNWMKQMPVTLGPDIILNDPAVNAQLDARLADGYGIPLEYDILLGRQNGKAAPQVVEIHTAISYETSLADRLRAAGYDPKAPSTRIGDQSPADLYASLSGLFAHDEPIVVMDTFPFDSTKADKIGMQQLMGGTLPISPMDIEGKDENGYYYHPYIKHPTLDNEILRDADKNPIRSTEKAYANNVFSRMAQADLDVLWENIKYDEAKVSLITDFLKDGNAVNWIWHPTWQHLGDKAMMPAVRHALVKQGNQLQEQYVPIYGPGDKVAPGRYVKKPTSGQGGIDQERITISSEDTNVEEGYVFQGIITPHPVLAYMPGKDAANMRRTGQDTLIALDLAAEQTLRPVTGILEARVLIPPYWHRNEGVIGRYMARTAPRWTSPDDVLERPQTNAIGLTNAIKEHMGEENFAERRRAVPFGMAPVIVFEA